MPDSTLFSDGCSGKSSGGDAAAVDEAPIRMPRGRARSYSRSGSISGQAAPIRTETGPRPPADWDTVAPRPEALLPNRGSGRRETAGLTASVCTGCWSRRATALASRSSKTPSADAKRQRRGSSPLKYRPGHLRILRKSNLRGARRPRRAWPEGVDVSCSVDVRTLYGGLPSKLEDVSASCRGFFTHPSSPTALNCACLDGAGIA